MAGTRVLKGSLCVCVMVLFIAVGPAKADWPMAGANPQRTSWVPEEVKGTLRVNWYRPVEAFIQGKVNLIGANDRIYVSTAKGLLILNYDDGSVAGRFDTQIPLGNAPTIVGNYAYVPGLDRTIYKLNALDGSYIDSFTGAKAGFHGNPLVVNDSFTDNNDVIFVGSRDGYLYAIDAATMAKLWQYPAEGQPPLGPIAMSPAYNNGVVYFVANNTLKMYAVDTAGNLIWVSQVLKGMQYQSFWPVIYQDKVMVFGSMAYSHGTDVPGMGVITNLEGTPFNTYQTMQGYMMTRGLYDTMPVVPDPCGTWHHGQTVYDGWRYSEYYEDNPEYDFYWHKPFRRTLMILNTADGSEYTCDVDNDGFADYAPIYYHGTRSGNASPPLVGPDDVIYFANYYNDTGVSHVRMMGWLFGTRYLSSISSLRTAFDEPTILSSGGTVLYRVLCCDREAVWADVDGGTGTLWSYSLPTQAPGYNIMWYDRSGESGLWGGFGNVNGIYHDHGDQNPLIPYNGKLYVHRSNCIICYGTSPAVSTPLPMVEMDDEKKDLIPAPTINDLKARLSLEIQKMVDAGNLKPGYYNRGQAQPNWYDNYFTNPGDTLHVLLRAYPHIDDPTLKTQLEAYLQSQWSEYFSPTMYAEKGWSEGIPRDDMDYPPDLADSMTTIHRSESTSSAWGWTYPQRNFYAMWKYAQLFPSETASAYSLAKSKITLPPLSADATMMEQPWIIHGYIAGYYGFLQLQTLAGQESDTVSGWTRIQIQNELNRLMQLRVNDFEKDTPWNNDNKRHWKRYNIARNFMWLTPEIGDYMHQNIAGKIQEAMDDYEWVAAYSFLSRFEADTQEGCMGVLDTYHALFQARAYALKESYEELTKYLDVPAFPRGDLFHIDNLIAAIEAPHAAPEITPDGGGTYIEPVTVEMSLPTVDDANMYYTLDGSEPNSNSTLYTGEFVLSSSATVKAVAYYAGEPGMIAEAVFEIDTGLSNQPPVVNAGPDRETAFPDNFVELAGSYTDSTLTFPPTAITTSWSQVDGPGVVVFDDAGQLETTATFPVVGIYTLRLSADEGGLVGTDDVVITVLPKPNEAPIVNAGADQQIVLPNTVVSLDGTVTDDALPDPPATVTTTWNVVSGPGLVTFADIYAVDTTATFTSSGDYVLQLAADDGEYDANDTMTVTVLPPVMPGVVCHLKLDDGAGTAVLDSSAYANDGAISGATWMADGADSNCLSFNGTNAVMLVPSTYHFDSAKGTWSLWVRTDGNWGVDGGSGGITERGTAALMVRHNSSASRAGLTVCLNAAGTVGFQAKNASAAVLGITSTGSVVDSNWHHVAVTWDQAAQGQMNIYIDGNPDTSGTNSDAWAFNNQPLRIADSLDTYWEEFAGQIDDVQVYNTVLSDADIAMLHNNAGYAKRAGDLNSSGTVDEVDLALMAAQWLQTPGNPSGDICPPPGGDGNVNSLDMAVLANEWLN